MIRRRKLFSYAVTGIVLAALAVTAGSLHRRAISRETYRSVTVLVDDNEKRCEDIAADVLAAWKMAASDPALALDTLYHSGPMRSKLAAMRRRTQQIRELLTGAGQDISRDSVIALHTAVVKLCNLAASPAGYSQLTFNERRSALRDEIATHREKLLITSPVTDRERARIVRKYEGPIIAELSRVKREMLDEERRQEQERLAGERARRAEKERETANTMYLMNEEIKRRELEIHARQDHLDRTRPQVKRWYTEKFPALLDFAVAAGQFASDLEKNYRRYAPGCASLRDSADILLAENIYKAPTQELSEPAEKVLRSYRAGAVGCLQGSDLGPLFSFTQADRALHALQAELAAYGFRPYRR